MSMVEYTHEQHLAAIAALFRIRKKCTNVKKVRAIAPAWVHEVPDGDLMFTLIEQIMDDFIEEIDRMVTERDYK